MFATTSWSGRVKLWDVATCSVKKVWASQEERGHSVAFNTAEGGTPMIISSCANGTASIFSLQNFDAEPVVLTGHEDRVNRYGKENLLEKKMYYGRWESDFQNSKSYSSNCFVCSCILQ